MSGLIPPLVEAVREAWKDALPDWVEALAIECARTSQSRVAQRLGRSPALVNQVLKKKYPGDLEAVRDLFNGVYRAEVVACPALGTLPLNECRDWRVKSRKFVNVNALRVRMYRACHMCPKNRKEESNAED